ncbi:MBL fold metallo-hydrolase [Candidatus Pacearchaeota archaeon]|nr:MBL fold metallo-hydrolase [Candidatus Pacearchaeota archaeon]
MYKVIASGSTGNAVLYFGCILVDCGVPFALIEPYLYDIQIVLLTHEHKDHFNPATVKKLMDNRPTMRIGCGSWMEEYLEGFRNVDVYYPGEVWDYDLFQICSIELYHDVPNCGYRIYKDGKQIFHATDSGHLEGIEARGYDLYAIESNYNEETIDAEIQAIEARGDFAYMKGVMNSHLSEQQADDFIYRNKAYHSQILRLHE